MALMDSELFYVRQASQVHQSYVYLVARKGDTWFSRIMDCMGLSPIQTHHRRPDMRSIKPYVLCYSWDEVAPLVKQYRDYYVRKHMTLCGFEDPLDPWESKMEFIEAVRTADGGVAVSASHRPKSDSRWVQTLITVNARTGGHHTYDFYEEESVRRMLKADLERIPAEEAEKAVRSEMEAWWDSKIEQCAKWEVAR